MLGLQGGEAFLNALQVHQLQLDVFGVIDTEVAPSGRVTLDFFGDTWSGTVLRAGAFAGKVTAIIVGFGETVVPVVGAGAADDVWVQVGAVV